MSVKFSNANAFPLCWPDGFPKTTTRISNNRFDTTLAKALENVQKALSSFAKDSGKRLTDIIISSNYSLTDTKPKDSGVAVYFTWDGERTCIPVDRYTLIEDNLQAIYHCIEAKRTMLRHGGINLVRAAFRGYAALPPATSVKWWDVLECTANSSVEAVQANYKRLRRDSHPDKPTGSHEKFIAVQNAYEAFEKERA